MCLECVRVVVCVSVSVWVDACVCVCLSNIGNTPSHLDSFLHTIIYSSSSHRSNSQFFLLNPGCPYTLTYLFKSASRKDFHHYLYVHPQMEEKKPHQFFPCKIFILRLEIPPRGALLPLCWEPLICSHVTKPLEVVITLDSAEPCCRHLLFAQLQKDWVLGPYEESLLDDSCPTLISYITGRRDQLRRKKDV